MIIYFKFSSLVPLFNNLKYERKFKLQDHSKLPWEEVLKVTL